MFFSILLTACTSSVQPSNNGATTVRDAVGLFPPKPCPESNVLYRYVARTHGSMANVWNHCIADSLIERTVMAPPTPMMGGCDPLKHGVVSTARRGPIEHALLLAIGKFEQNRHLTLRNASKNRSEKTAGMVRTLQHQVHQDVVRFALNEDTQCISKLRLYSESKGSVRPALDGIISHKDLEMPGRSIMTGLVLVEHTLSEQGHVFLIEREKAYEGARKGEFLKERVRCISTGGPIAVGETTRYRFSVSPTSDDEWNVCAVAN